MNYFRMEVDLCCTEYMPSEEELDAMPEEDCRVCDSPVEDKESYMMPCGMCGKEFLWDYEGDVCPDCVIEPPYLGDAEPYSEFFSSDDVDYYIIQNTLNIECDKD